MKAEEKLTILFKKLVPEKGPAATVAGEILRATGRIGDHIGVGYGNETCNPAARYLMKTTNADIARAIINMWGVKGEARYRIGYLILLNEVLDYIDANPELKETKNNENMFDYYDEHEDKDDGEDDVE